MYRSVRVLVLLLCGLCILGGGCQSQCQKCKAGGKVVLFNEKNLDGWVFQLKDDQDPSTIWSVNNGVVHCTGSTFGYMRTENSYENYQLHLEWRWVDGAANSGVLLHITGQDKVWPQCIESQLQTGNAGDIVLMQGAGLSRDGKDFTDAKKQFVMMPKMEPSSEKPLGQWNSYDIVCSGDTLSCTVNGVLQNSGTHASVTSGPIGLQSEGGPIEFRNIYIIPIQ